MGNTVHTIRSIAAQDYPAVVALHNAQNEPDWHTTPARMAKADAAQRQAATTYLRLVAEHHSESGDSTILGTATLTSHWAGFFTPHHYWITVETHSNHRHQGVDNALLDALLAKVKVQDSPQQLWTCIREDFVPPVEFLEAFAFREVFRSWGSHLDVQAFDVTAYNRQKEALERAGIHFYCYVDLPIAHREQELVAFHKQIEDDVPYYEPIIPKTHDDIRSLHVPEESCFVALAGDKIIGMASLNTENPRLLQNGLTGVHRDHRNKGIATVLKALVADYAKTHGHLDINAAGSGANNAMRHVNEKLGYVIEPDWITFRAVL